MIGNEIYDFVSEMSNPHRASKLTGMIIGLEDELELIKIIDNETLL